MTLQTRFIRPSLSTSGSVDTLPADIAEVVLNRIVLLCLSPPVLVFLGNLVNLVNSFVFGFMSFDYTWLEAIHDLVITVISLVTAWTVHRRLFSTQTLISLGLAYCVFTSLWFAATECLIAREYQNDAIRLGISYFSFALVWVVFFPAIVPMRSRDALVTIVLAASLSPLTRWLAQRLGWVEFSEGSVLFVSIATVFSVLLGLVVSNVVYKLGRSVSEAREMGSYRLERNLGSGGMGEVWVASHRMLARSAAVKFMKPEVFAGMELDDVRRLNQRFEQEVQATAALHSPHTVDIYDYGVTPDGTFYYVMELLSGIDLESLVRRFGPIEPARAVFLLIQACHSLHEAHSRQLIHRDIKPANLFICEYGEDFDFVKVLDFGLVKYEEASGETDPMLTREGVITGTPAYMYPEAITGKSPVDARSDIYSMGCVAYWLLTGGLVFPSENSLAMLAQHANSSPAPMSQRTEIEIPEALEKVVMACLAKDPRGRRSGAEELADRLRRIPFDRHWDNEQAQRWWRLHRAG